MVQAIQRFWKEEDGQGLVEYGLIIGLVAVVVIGVLSLMGGSINSLFTKVNGSLSGNSTASTSGTTTTGN